MGTIYSLVDKLSTYTLWNKFSITLPWISLEYVDERLTKRCPLKVFPFFEFSSKLYSIPASLKFYFILFPHFIIYSLFLPNFFINISFRFESSFDADGFN